MTKSLRSRLVGAILILASALTVSAVNSAANLDKDPSTKLDLMKAPPPPICEGKPITIVFRYSLAESAIPLHPLVPKKGTGDDETMGTLKVEADGGKVDPPSVLVWYDGYTSFTYTPKAKKDNTDTLYAELTYPGGHHAVDVLGVPVEKCKSVTFKIKASLVQVVKDQQMFSSTTGQGTLDYASGKFHGKILLKGEYYVMPANQAAICTPQKSEGKGFVEITGEYIKPKLWGDPKINLKLVYDPMEGFKDGKTVCKDRKTGKAKDFPFESPGSDSPSKYLSKVLAFSADDPRVKGSYGPNDTGSAEYEIFFAW